MQKGAIKKSKEKCISKRVVLTRAGECFEPVDVFLKTDFSRGKSNKLLLYSYFDSFWPSVFKLPATFTPLPLPPAIPCKLFFLISCMLISGLSSLTVSVK